MVPGSENAKNRDKYLSELASWLDCGNRSWIGDDLEIDPNGGCAMDIAIGAAKRLMGKLQAIDPVPAAMAATVGALAAAASAAASALAPREVA